MKNRRCMPGCWRDPMFAEPGLTLADRKAYLFGDGGGDQALETRCR
jgi:hypothetical protein